MGHALRRDANCVGRKVLNIWSWQKLRERGKPRRMFIDAARENMRTLEVIIQEIE